jgi:beta-phosphoglucomutase-like phosphatase (HAD superfamily)
MPLTLEQYAHYLDTRDLTWPAPPEVKRAKARPHLKPLAGVKAVLWSTYGTLITISGGELYFEHPEALVMDVALTKTVDEYKMWGSMTRKPGQPAEYLKRIYDRVLLEQRSLCPGGERHPEIVSERIWEAILKTLLQKDYKFDAVFFGGLDEYSRKIAYFFHANLQGTACPPAAADALCWCHEHGAVQGLLGDGQCFTGLQLQRGLEALRPGLKLDELISPDLRILSYEVRARKPSPRIFREALDRLALRGIEPHEVLHVGTSLIRDIAPARKLRMRTALFAGDKESLQAKSEELREEATRPDVLLTKLDQIASVLGS